MKTTIVISILMALLGCVNVPRHNTTKLNPPFRGLVFERIVLSNAPLEKLSARINEIATNRYSTEIVIILPESERDRSFDPLYNTTGEVAKGFVTATLGRTSIEELVEIIEDVSQVRMIQTNDQIKCEPDVSGIRM